MSPLPSLLRQLKRRDEQRAGVPGEHWAVFGTGLSVLGWARGRRSPLLRTAATAVGVLMLIRAATGRDGPLQRLRQSRQR